MEYQTNLINISNDQKHVAAGKRTVPSLAHQRTKLRDMLMSNAPNWSDADLHHEVTRSQDHGAHKHVHSRQRHLSEKRMPKEDELVRYMSNLPSFLEKGKNMPDKVLNVGVLDWKRLEKWQHNKKQMPHKHTECSPASDNTSLFTTDGSSTYSSRGPSCSPARQRMHRLSLQSPLEPSPREASSLSRGHSCSPVRQGAHSRNVLRSHPRKVYEGIEKHQDIDAFRVNAGKFQDSGTSSAYTLSRQQNLLGPQQQGERKAYDLTSFSDMDQQPILDKDEVVGRANTGRNQSSKEPQRFRKNAADQDCSEREKPGAVIMPREQSETSCSGVTSSSYFTANDRLSVETGPKNISGSSNYEHWLLSKVDSSKCSFGYGSRDLEDGKNSLRASNTSVQTTKNFLNTSRIGTHTVTGHSEASQTVSFSARMLGSPTRSRKTEEKKPVAGLRSTTAAKPSEEWDVRKSSEYIPKSRNPSPIRRLSFAMGKLVKNAGSRDNSPVRRSISKDCAGKSGYDGTTVSTPSDNSCSDKSAANNTRSRSSPLRRLLDPFLKHRGSNGSEPSKKPSSPAGGSGRSCSDQVDYCNPGKVKSKSSSSKQSFPDPHHDSKNGSSSLQALLQVSFKNGFPLFTFAIDNESEVLAATVRTSFLPAKGQQNCTYTFFTVREVKRKSGIWLSKGDSHGYVPNVVAQMKVSDSQDSPCSEYENANIHINREYNLFAVDAGHEDQYATDFHPTNELAAIIAKLPRTTFSENRSKDDWPNYNWLDSSHPSITRTLQERRSSAEHKDDSQNPHLSEGLNFNTTVILPGGVHTVPSKGEISTLLHRWRSGGSCDCGGWDLGCQLVIYTNKRKHERKTVSFVTHPSKETFHLFSQVGQDNKTILSLAPFKERMYSVEFNSSLSLLQAFAICISFLDCRRPAELSGPINVAADKTTNNEVGVFEPSSPTKASNHQLDTPARYFSYPPDSPVGRV